MNRNKTSELADKARQGDRAAFEALYKAYSKKIYYFALQNTGSEAAAEDVTSETFADAMESIGSLRSGEAFSGWLFAIAYKKCADHIGSTSRSTSIDSEELLSADVQGDTVMLPYDYAESRETVEKLKEIIDGLSPDQRSAVIMYYYDEMSVSEVAEAMGTNVNNVSQKLHRARKRIKKQIEKLIGKGAMFGAVPMGKLIGDLDLGTKGIAAGAAAAIAAGIPYGLSKASGGTARELLWITRKYWAKHKKSLAALMFSGVLLCAVVTCIFLMMKQSFIRELDDQYDQAGYYSLIAHEDSTDIINVFAKEDSLRGEVSVIGKAGIGKTQFEIGTLNDPENLAHLPIEQGRLPEKDGELAAYRSALEDIGFFGSVGDEIKLDRGTYKLVGILKDKELEYRWNTRKYINQVYGGDVYGGDAGEERFPYAFPMFFTGGDHSSEVQYKWIMLDNIDKIRIPNKDNPVYYAGDNYSFEDGIAAALSEIGVSYYDIGEGVIDIKPKASIALAKYNYSFRIEHKKMMPLYISCCLIAILSVIAVMRSIFAERENTIRMLRRIGVSKRRIRVMYAIEYLCLAAVQTVIGLALGTAAHLGITAYQVNVLDMKDFTGFSSDEYASWLLPAPFTIGIVISAAVLLAGYLFAALMSHIKAPDRKKRKASALWRCFGRVFRTRTVTVIQTVALALICFGAVYGYILFRNSQGEFDLATETIKPMIDTYFGNNGQFDFEEEDVEEYYHAEGVKNTGIGSFLFTLHSDHCSGIDDSVADTLEGVTARGLLPQTFIAAGKDSKLKNSVAYGSAEEKQFFLDNSSDEGKALLSSDKELYKSPLALADIGTIDKLSQYVTAGEINADKLNSGEEVLMILRHGESPLAVGEAIKLGYAETENGFGISKVTLADTEIGTVITLPNDLDKILRYSITAGDDYNLLTTASGAEAMKFFGARYTELFAKEALGNSLPLGTGFILESYAQREHEIFLQNAGFYGSLGALILLMSLLGFSAYFNGIGLKIRLKEYQISVMRAVGTPIKRLRRRLTLDSIRIPVISGAAAFGAITLLQRFILYGYDKAKALNDEASEIAQKVIDSANTLSNAEIDRLSDTVNDLQRQSLQTGYSYLTNTHLWIVNALIPTLTIFAMMCIVTILLTRKSFRMFTPDIAGALARGRKRR